MIAFDDGGPAFPFNVYDFQPHTGQQVVRQQFDGMSLHDWFAGKALEGMLAEGRSNSSAATWMPQEAYDIADAMIAERAKRRTKP